MPHKASILIVEDEAVVAADLAGKLERAGYRLIGTAPKGEQAIELAKIETPDLVLMDIRLAGSLDGVETADRLRAFLNIPIVYLTAHSDAETLKRAKQTEPFGYILKPFEERDLTTQIEIALYRHQAQILLRDSEGRYRSVVETAMDSIILIDRKGTMLSCNSATERMFGYDRMDMLGRNVSMLMPPEYREAYDGYLTVAPNPTESGVIGLWRELKGQRKDSVIFPIEIALSRTEIRGQIHYTGIVRDISERVRAEAEIRWRADLLEQTHEAVIVWRMDGGIVYWNRGAAELYGWTAEETAGRPAHELLNTTLPLPLGDFERHLLETGGWYGEMHQSKKDGTPVIVESRMTPVSDGGGGTLVMETNRDVTERHAIHQQVCRLAEELDQRVKDRTKDLLLSRERLRGLAAELSLTEQRERKRLAAELHDHLAQLLVLGRLKLSQAKRMPRLDPACAAFIAQTAEVIDESLRYTRTLVADLSPPVLRDFGLPSALRWLCDYMRRYDLVVTIALDEQDDFKLPEDHAVLMFQSVRELLMNVHKHAGSGEATVSVAQHNGALRIDVRDNGKGFDSSAAADGVPSTRFGLFSIRERMHALGGAFDVESTPGKGTAATLTLPLRAASSELGVLSSELPRETSIRQAPAFASASSNSEPITQNSQLHEKHPIRVLLVDDHAMVRQGLRSLLEQYPEVEIVGEAGDGSAAVVMALSLKPDVVIMDVNMPNMDGVEATERIKADHPAAIVIGLSMHDSGHYETTMMKAGAAAYLSKDSVSDHLHATMLACRLESDGVSSQPERTP